MVERNERSSESGDAFTITDGDVEILRLGPGAMLVGPIVVRSESGDVLLEIPAGKTVGRDTVHECEPVH